MFLFAFEAGTAEENEAGGARETVRRAVAEQVPTGALPAVVDLCDTLVRQWADAHPAERFRGQALFHELLYRLFRLRGEQAPGGQDAALEQAEAYLRQHYGESVTVEKLAAVKGLSERHLMRQFKAKYGSSIMSYLNELRIGQARRLLTGAVRKVSDVSAQVGYRDEYYFIRKFKRQVGIPPAAYMRNRQRKVAAYSWFNLGHLLPLQIVPEIAPLDHWWTDDYRRKYASDVSVLLSHDYGFNRRVLERAEPDAIVALDTMDPAEQGSVRQIAPAVFVPWMGQDWRGHLRVAAAFLGKEREAELWLRAYERKASLVREQVRRRLRDETVLVARPAEDGCEIFGGRNVGAVLYGDLGLAPAGAAERIPVVRTVGFAELAACDPDRIVLLASEAPRVRANVTALRLTDVWRELRAVAQGKVHVVPEDPWTEYTAYGHNRLLDDALRVFGGIVQEKSAAASI